MENLKSTLQVSSSAVVFNPNLSVPKPSLSVPHHHLFKPLKASKNTPSLINQGEDHYYRGLKFIRNKKLMSDLSTWGIGGPCNYFVQVFNQTQLISALNYCSSQSLRFLIVGKGSNCLFDDRGFDGCVINNRIDFFEKIEPGAYRVGSGYPFHRMGLLCSNEGFTGLEFAAGIPGTVGGATFMNAGADGQETGDAVKNVEILTMDGECRVMDRANLMFGYRKSSFQVMETLAAIFAVTFRLTPSSSARERQQAYLGRRRRSQPIGEQSAGSVFRNPPGLGISAGELIEKAGLKGFRVGGAKISDVHANFFINFDGSTSRDMLELVNLVKEKINREFGIELEEEIQYVPYCC